MRGGKRCFYAQHWLWCQSDALTGLVSLQIKFIMKWMRDEMKIFPGIRGFVCRTCIAKVKDQRKVRATYYAIGGVGVTNALVAGLI